MTYQGAESLPVYNELIEKSGVDQISVYQSGRMMWVYMEETADANDVCRVQNVAMVNGYKMTDAIPQHGHINTRFKLEKKP